MMPRPSKLKTPRKPSRKEASWKPVEVPVPTPKLAEGTVTDALSEGEVVQAIPEAPHTLGSEGRFRWEQYCTLLRDRGMLTPHYMPSVEMLCRLHDQLQALDVELNGRLMVPGLHGEKMHPLVPERSRVSYNIRLLLTDLGLTPTSSKGAAPVVSEGANQKKTRGVVSRNRYANFG